MAKLTIDIEPFIEKRMQEIHAAIEAGCHEILREAFEAGYDKGFRSGAYGPDEFGHFEEWVADFIETHREG